MLRINFGNLRQKAHHDILPVDIIPVSYTHLLTPWTVTNIYKLLLNNDFIELIGAYLGCLLPHAGRLGCLTLVISLGLGLLIFILSDYTDLERIFVWIAHPSLCTVCHLCHLGSTLRIILHIFYWLIHDFYYNFKEEL